MIKTQLANVPHYHEKTALGLIKVFRVRQGYGLAALLGMPDQYDNHSAVCYWVDQQANKDGTIYTNSKSLLRRFRDQIESYGYCCEGIEL